MGSLLGMQGGISSAFSQQTAYQQMMAKQQTDMVYGPHCGICGEPGIHITDQCPKTKTQENKTMYDAIKKWFDKHSDLLVTVTAIFLADHFVFGGKFRHKIENMLDGLIDKVQKKVEAHEA